MIEVSALVVAAGAAAVAGIPAAAVLGAGALCGVLFALALGVTSRPIRWRRPTRRR